MEVSMMVVTTSHVFKIEHLHGTLESLDACHGTAFFREKHLCVDEYGPAYPSDLIEEYEQDGWTIHRNVLKSLPHNHKVGLDHISTEWVYYSEDDVHVDPFPTMEMLDYLDDLEIDGRPIGHISFRCGGLDQKNPESLVHLRDRASYLNFPPSCDPLVPSDRETKNGSGVIIWKRSEDLRDCRSWIEFPCCFFRTGVFRTIWAHASNNYPGCQIEHAYSKSWFDQGLDQDYSKVSLVLDPTAVCDMDSFSIGDYDATYHDQLRLTRHPYLHSRKDKGNYSSGLKVF
jgi:hypothetical protein